MRRLTLLLAALVAAAGLQAATADTTKVTDVRLTMDDGVTLTADLYLPPTPQADADADGRIPCVVELTPYRKESRAAEGASYLPGAGIALIEVDARGTGGSEGEYDIVFSVREQADAAAWVEWAAGTATDPQHGLRCEETVGMYGGSYSGIIQYLVASLPDVASDDLPARPPHLAAIAPQRAYGDLYRDIVYHGGQLIGSFGLIWAGGTQAYYTQPPADIATPAGQAAWMDHLTQNDPMMLNYIEGQYADARWTSDDSPSGYAQDLYADSSVLSRIDRLRVPTLHLAGFYDTFTRGALMTFARAHELEMTADDGRGPNFLIAGPWTHADTHFITPDQGFKGHLGEWYRYWLEGREAGHAAPTWITGGFDGAGARVRYFQHRSSLVNPPAPIAAEHGSWQTSATWPPPVDMQRLYLRAGAGLSPEPPAADEAADLYAYNPSAGAGELASRWDNAAYGGAYRQWDQRIENGKGLTYQTDALDADLALAGPITLNLIAATSGVPAPPGPQPEWPGAMQVLPPHLDTDFVVKLSDVAPDGSAMLVTQGYLRASHRALSDWRVLDGEVVDPIHPHTLGTLEPPLQGDPTGYTIEIWPTAKTFQAGHRLRLDILPADTPSHIGLAIPVVNQVFHQPGVASYLAIPVVGG